MFFFLLNLLTYLQINIINYFQECMNQLECMNVTSLIDYRIQNWWELNQIRKWFLQKLQKLDWDILFIHYLSDYHLCNSKEMVKQHLFRSKNLNRKFLRMKYHEV